jgi:predicted permease
MTDDRARRWYRLLLLLAPSRLRRHAPEMEALFIDMRREARTATRGEAYVWSLAVRDVFAASCGEPFRRRRSRIDLPEERQALMFGSDLKLALRVLWRQKFSTFLVVSMLAIGIAANVAVFSLVNGLFLRPFPFPDPDRLVYLNETAPRWNLELVGINFPDFHRWRQDQRLFEAIGMFEEASFNIADGRGAERVEGLIVTYDFATALGVRPALGRSFTADEDKPGAPPVVVIGHRLWMDRFGGEAGALGRTLKIDGVVRTVVGVLPPEADFPGRVRLWVPKAGDPNQDEQSYGGDGIGRLKPGVSVDDARRDLERAHQPIWDARDQERTVSPLVRPLRDQLSRSYRTSAAALLGAVLLLLIVACANVASVMLARALARKREMGIRLAIGATRLRIARQLTVENLVLACAGGLAGVLLGRRTLDALLAAIGDRVPGWTSFALDARVVVFAVVVTAATALFFGWLPALHASRGDVRAAMHESSAASTAGPGARRTLAALVAAEFALCALLLVCGGLLLRAFQRVSDVDPGFRQDHVLTFTLALPENVYDQSTKRLVFWDGLIERLRGLPGVSEAAVVSCAPLGCHWGTFFQAEGAPPRAAGDSNPVVLYRYATPDYARVMGLRLKSGRFIDPHLDRAPPPGGDPDTPGERAVVINETFARTFWPGVENPVGRRIRTGSDGPWVTVVGLVADVKHYGLERPMRPGVYFPLVQSPIRSGTVTIRTSVEPASLLPSARDVVHRLDPEMALFRVRTMEQALAESMRERAVYSWLLGVFALFALLLALGGAYGVASYLVTQRTRELGIRVALGARAGQIASAVLRDGMLAAGMGVAIGVAISAFVSRAIEGLLFGVAPNDPAVLIAGAGVLLASAALANWLPARRAARLDPMRTLRTD